MADNVTMYTPAGRVIAGSMSEPFTKDYDGKVRDKPQYFFALAVAKNAPGVNELLQSIYANAYTQYAASQQADVVRRIMLGFEPDTAFAFKIDNGDHAKFASKANYAGHWVFKFTTVLGIDCVNSQGLPLDPKQIKCGYYVDVAFTMNINGRVDRNAGVFLNPQGVRLLGIGDEIKVSRDVGKLFGGRAAVQMGQPAPQGPFAGAPSAQGYAPPPAAPGLNQGNGYAASAVAGIPPAPNAMSYPSNTAPYTPAMSAPPVAAPQYSPTTLPPQWSDAPAPLAPGLASDQGAPANVTGGPALTPPDQTGANASGIAYPIDLPTLPGFSDGPTE